jgi:hypothetical protein
MSDEHLRSLERQWRSTRSFADEAAYLQERERLGLLDRTALILASFVGSQAASRVTSTPPLPAGRDPAAWLDTLVDREPGLAVRAALGAVRHIVPMGEWRPEFCERHGAKSCADSACHVDGRPRASCEIVLAQESVGAQGAKLLAAARACLASSRKQNDGSRWDRVSIARQDHIPSNRTRYGEATYRRDVAKAAFWLTCAAIARHGSGEERGALVSEWATAPDEFFDAIYVQSFGRTGQLLQDRLSETAEPIGRDHVGQRLGALFGPPQVDQWEPRWRDAAVDMSRLTIGVALTAARAFTRQDSARRGVDANYAIGEALEDTRKRVREELVAWILHGGPAPLPSPSP